MNSSPRIRPWQGYLALSLFWLSTLGGALWLARRPVPQPVEILPAPSATLSPSPAPLHVDVAGAVLAPGVYHLPPGSVVAEAIAAAGGPAGDADLDRINKATRLQDGTQVYVPRRNETALPTPLAPATAPAARSESSSRTSGIGGQPVNLNTCSGAELEALPGIGPVMAQRIIAGRPYTATEDLLRVQGIGPATLRKLQGLVTTQ